ncbi:hypothetical protein SMICM17S_00912 [Streptomyces microflavus]
MTVKSFNRAMTIGFRTVAASALTAAVVLGGARRDRPGGRTGRHDGHQGPCG